MLITDNYELSWNGELGWYNNIKFSFGRMKNVFKERNYNKNWTLHKLVQGARWVTTYFKGCEISNERIVSY